MTGNFAESDLYEPIKNFLSESGYDVKSEVKSCDIAAFKDNTMLIIELKKSFNLKLVYQVIERQSITPFVFAAIPRNPKGNKNKDYKSMIKLLKKLNIGLITVALDSPIKTVEVVLTPQNKDFKPNFRKKSSFQKEFDQRSGEYNTGGVSKTKIITAYREKSLEIACFLKINKEVTLSEFREAGFNDKELSILYKNFYGWFFRVKKGVYGLSSKGEEEIKDEHYKELVDYFCKKHLKKEGFDENFGL